MIVQKVVVQDFTSMLNNIVDVKEKDLRKSLSVFAKLTPVNPEKSILPSDFNSSIVDLENELSKSDDVTWSLMAVWDKLQRYTTTKDTKSVLADVLAKYGKTVGTMGNYYNTWHTFNGKSVYRHMTFQRHGMVAPLYRMILDSSTPENVTKSIVGVLESLNVQSGATPMTDSTFKMLVSTCRVRLGIDKRKRNSRKSYQYSTLRVSVSGKTVTLTLPDDKDALPSGNYKRITFTK